MAQVSSSGMPEPTASGPRSKVESLFLLSTYVTLGLACACITYAELTLMRQIVFFAAITVVVLIVSFLLEGKWSLSLRAANLLGGGIAAFTGIWIAIQMQRPTGGLLVSLPFPTVLLPYLGPVMMFLLVAKLLRPKQIGDHWGLQFIGLVCVALACALADDAMFGFLLILYFISGLWCLAVFSVYRQTKAGRERNAGSGLPKFGRTSLWTVAAICGAFVLFMYTPRSASQWQLSGSQKQRMEVGLSDDPTIDMNRTGQLELNSETVFEVRATNQNGSEKTDLNPGIRWRGPSFRYYTNGKWQNINSGITAAMSPPRVATMGNAPQPPLSGRAPTYVLPDLGTGQYFLEYTIRGRIGPTAFLAQPIVIAPNGELPVISLRSSGPTPWQLRPDGTLTPTDAMNPGTGKYRQVLPRDADPELSTSVAYQRQNLLALADLPASVRALEPWTKELIRRLVASGRLSAECLERLGPDDRIQEQYHEEVARSLESFLADSGEFRYSLTLERADESVDPALDFLFYTRTGHCNRFATALTLLLRALRIPSQIVLGYRGFETVVDGQYDVKQCHAHAWVEVLVPRRGPTPAHGLRRGPESWHWLSLDPTPSQEAQAASASASSKWWTSGSWDRDKLFRSLILNFSADSRDELGHQIWQVILTSWGQFQDRLLDESAEGWRFRTMLLLVGAAMVLSIALVWQFIRYRRWRKLHLSLRAEVAFHRRMLQILARRGWKPTQSQTPLEFARSLATPLAALANGPSLIQIVDEISSLYYRVRFGSQPLSIDEGRRIEGELRILATQTSAAR